ncbi:MAG: peptide deformylase [Planctomycetes bacterium]|nr:peptide deformylase [Planctomycetota bacterium]
MRVEIVLWPHPVLLAGTKPVEQADVDADFRDTVAQMTKLMVDLRGVGLAAPQAGIGRRFMLVSPTGEAADTKAMLNPEILAREGEEDMEEGCLSFPKVYGNVRRAARVKARYRDLDFVEHTVELEGFVARIFQHELDHLDGVVFIDRMDDADLEAAKPRLAELKKARAAAAK